MWTTFLVALKANLRNRQALFWMIVFPIVLATMFNGFFGGLSEGYELKPIPMAVVEDSRWQQADGARTFVDALSGGRPHRRSLWTARHTPISISNC